MSVAESSLPWVFAAAAAGGGGIGYIKKKSFQSLTAGTVFGALISISQIYDSAGLGLACTCALGGYMARSFVRTQKIMPAGVMTGFSAVMLLFYLKALS